MAKAIEELPPRGKQAFKLHRYDGLTYKEIAQVMDVSVKTVESQMMRTLKKLRASLSHLLPFIVLAITS
jgi:RNA polymerase sigma-70 factor (ECF subfamily)